MRPLSDVFRIFVTSTAKERRSDILRFRQVDRDLTVIFLKIQRRQVWDCLLVLWLKKAGRLAPAFIHLRSYAPARPHALLDEPIMFLTTMAAMPASTALAIGDDSMSVIGFDPGALILGAARAAEDIYQMLCELLLPAR